jgi:alpha-tubulin suppressor-like RCC1 family protein
MVRRICGAVAITWLAACLDTQLPPSPGPGSITGRVLVAAPGEPLGTPAAGATITLVEAGLTTTSQADGRFTLAPVSQGEGTLEITSGALKRLLSLETLGAGFGRTTVLGDVALSRNASVQGEVLLEGGDEPAGTLVFLEGQPSSAYTNQAGQFLLRELPVGPVTLSLYRPGYAPQRLPLELRSGERTIVEAVQLRPLPLASAQVRGRAVLEGLDDASGITVSTGASEVDVEPDGSWRLPPFSPGVHSFTFRAPGRRTVTLLNRLIAASEVELPLVTLTPGEGGVEPNVEPIPPYDAGPGGGGGGSTGGGGGSTGGGGGSTGGGGGGGPLDAGPGVQVTRVSAGTSHTCAVLSDQRAFCWGRDTFGQINGPAGADAVGPTLVARDVIDIAAGGTHTCVVHTDAGVECWGSNSDYQLGITNPDAGQRSTLAIAARSVSAGARFTCAVAGAEILCWGSNSDLQVGNGSVSSRVLPGTMNLVTIAEAVAAGDAHTCALMTVNGVPSVKCVGRLFANATQPGNVILTDVSRLSSGGQHTCGLQTDGTVSCWGMNGAGQLGFAGGQQNTPTVVPGLSNGVAIAAGGQHSCAVRSGGVLECWGSNAYGQLGGGPADGGIARVTPSLAEVTSVSAGGVHTCAIRSDGSLWCWGGNGWGQLGVDAGAVALEPVRVELTAE